MIALAVCLSFADVKPVLAQDCEPVGSAPTVLGMQVPAQLASTVSAIQAFWKDFTAFIGPVASTLTTISFFTTAASNPTCLALITCEQQFFQQLSATATSAATMHSAIEAKAADYRSASAYNLQMQSTQSQMAIQSGAGSSSTPGASGNLSYMNNNLCVAATTASAGAQVNQSVIAYVAQDPWANGGGSGQALQVYPGKPSTNYTYNTNGGYNLDSTQMLQKLYANTYAFDNLSGFAKDSDENIEYLLNQYAFSTANSPSDQNAMDQFSNYIVGLPSQNPHVPVGSSDPVAVQSQIAFKEQNTFHGIVAMPLAFVEGEHIATTTPNASNIQAIFSAAQYPVNVNATAAAPTGQISQASLFKATFQLVGTDVNNFSSLGSLVPTKALQYIAGALSLSNWLDYERYQVEERDLILNDAFLALELRQANFMQEP